MPEPQKQSNSLSRGQIFVMLAAVAGIISFIADSTELYEKVRPWLVSIRWFPSDNGLARKPLPVETKRSIENDDPPRASPLPQVVPPKSVIEPEQPKSTAALPNIPPLTRHDILVNFAPYAVASPLSGVEIVRVDRQSKLDGWLCVEDRLVKVDGAPLQGNSGAELQDDLMRKLQASPNFVVHFKPARPSKTIELDGELGVVRGWKVFQNLAQKRLC